MQTSCSVVAFIVPVPVTDKLCFDKRICEKAGDAVMDKRIATEAANQKMRCKKRIVLGPLPANAEADLSKSKQASPLPSDGKASMFILCDIGYLRY